MPGVQPGAVTVTTTMYWRPAPKDVPPGHGLPDSLKRIIADRLWNHDGTLHAETAQLGTQSDLAYLEGLRDAGVDGADELLSAIRNHGLIEVWIGE